MYIDVHCHLDRQPLAQQLDDVIKRAREAGMGLIITAGTDPAANDKALSIAARYPDIVRCSLGMYPLDAAGVDEEGRKAARIDVDAEIARMEALSSRCVAIGEVGLDFKFTKEPSVVAKQKEAFAKLIALAERIKKPLVVHTRGAELDVVEMLETAKTAVVLHCFMGRKSLVRRASDNGWSFSVPPIIARSQQFQILAEMVPTEQLLTETDAPWLSPTPGTVNEPVNVSFSIAGIAKAQHKEEAVVKEQVWQNAKRVFGI